MVGRYYKTFFDFEIIYNSQKRKSLGEIPENVIVHKIVDKRRIYINKISSLCTFKRILFDDCDYFSYSDVLLISQSFGEKIRMHDYQMNEYNSLDLQ